MDQNPKSLEKIMQPPLNDIANELPESEQNGDVGSRPSDDILAHHEVNNGNSAANQTGGNVSNIKTDGSNTDAYSTTTYIKLQGGANLEKNKAMDRENKTSTDHRGNNVDFSCNGPNIKERKRKAFHGISPDDNSFTVLQHDSNVTNVIRPDDHITRSYTTMILKSKNSTTAGFEEDNFALDGQRSSIFTESLEPEHYGDMGSRPSDDIVAQHEGNNGYSESTQTGGNGSIHCGYNQSTNSFNLNCCDNNLSIDHNPKYSISSGHGRDKKGFSVRMFNSQDQTPAITKSPNNLSPTSSTYFQQYGEVLVSNNLDDPLSLPCGAEIRSPLKSKIDKRNYRGISSTVYKTICIFLMTVLLGAPVQASPEWQLYNFNMMNSDVIYQILTIKNMKNRDSADCTFNVTALPFLYNCSQSGSLVFAYNETHIEMATADLSTKDYSLEHGNSLNGHNLPATRGEKLDKQSLEDKIAGITKPTVTTSQLRTLEDNDPTVWIIIGVGVPLVAFIVLGLLYIFCRSFRRWIQSFVSLCRRRNTNNVPETDVNPSHEVEP